MSTSDLLCSLAIRICCVVDGFPEEPVKSTRRRMRWMFRKI